MLEVGKTREGRFLIVFLLQFLTFSAFLAYHEVVCHSDRCYNYNVDNSHGNGPIGIR